MPNLDWDRLTPLQLGRYAEYYIKMEFSSYGFYVFSSEVDGSGIDFIVKSKTLNSYYEIQVKSIRDTSGYVFAQKDKFDVSQENLFMAVVIFRQNYHPNLYLIPATAWKNPNELLRDRDYEGLKSKPEWGINTSRKNMPLLEKYTFLTMIEKL